MAPPTTSGDLDPITEYPPTALAAAYELMCQAEETLTECWFVLESCQIDLAAARLEMAVLSDYLLGLVERSIPRADGRKDAQG